MIGVTSTNVPQLHPKWSLHSSCCSLNLTLPGLMLQHGIKCVLLFNKFPMVCVKHYLETLYYRAACCICAIWDQNISSWSKSLSTCLGELKWPSLAQRCTFFSIDYLHSILHHKTYSDYFKLKPNSSYTRSHQLTMQSISSSFNAFHYFLLIQFFCVVNSIFLWNHIATYRYLEYCV